MEIWSKCPECKQYHVDYTQFSKAENYFFCPVCGWELRRTDDTYLARLEEYVRDNNERWEDLD